MANCFKIHGYPEWYKTLKNRKASSHMRSTHVNAALDPPLDCDIAESNPEDGLLELPHGETNLYALIQKEKARYLKN